jgi:small GTP-binding protein
MVTKTGETFQYDVFISHSSMDKRAVCQLAERLKEDGLRVWLDDWEIQPGDMVSLKIEEGLEHSRTLLLVTSAQAFASDWVTLERHTALFRDPTNTKRRFIPLRLDDAPIQDVLKQFAYIDWRQQDEDEYDKLLTACQPVSTSSGPIIGHKDDQFPGFVLKTKVTSGMNCVAVTPDGRFGVGGAESGNIRLWDIEERNYLVGFAKHLQNVVGVAMSADGRRMISGSGDGIRVWDLISRRCLATFTAHLGSVSSVTMTPDGQRGFSGASDGLIYVWDLNTGNRTASLVGHTSIINGIAVTPDGQRVVSGASDNTVRVWDVQTKNCVATLEGHRHWVWSVAVTENGQRVISSSGDGTIRAWDVSARRCLATLEGHTGAVLGIAMTPDGRRAVSGSADKTVRIWDVEGGRCLATLKKHTGMVRGIAITSDGQRAVSSSDDGSLIVWHIPMDAQAVHETEASKYTNAKVLLVGDSGVGKSGLAIKLTTDRFEPTISTDAVWATQMPLPHDTSTAEIEGEIWLWDFAGQADYRLVHQLYMDEAAVAVLVFNPQKENPFEGLEQWKRALESAARRRFRKLLVAGRCDRGRLMVSRVGIEQFLKQRGFEEYLETSAQTGMGCAELRAAIINNIPWDDIPWTSSPRIFKLLKNEIIKLKDDAAKDEGKALLRMAELKQQLEMRLPGESFTPDELRAVVGLLAGPGIVWQLEFGDFVLLQPERINAYAAAVIRSVCAHPEEIGCISEERILEGELNYEYMKRLSKEAEEIVLRAMHQTFVDHGLCLRETTDQGMLLIFPSYFRRERPEVEDKDCPAAFVTYEFSGPLDEIYAALIVRLNHTSAFEKDQLWRFAADFKTQGGKLVRLKMTKKPEGTAGIIIYFEPDIPDDTKVTFIRYVHDHLIKMKAQDVVRIRHYVCENCGFAVEDHKAVQRRLERGQKDIICTECDHRVLLVDLIEKKFGSEKVQRSVNKLAEEALNSIDSESQGLILLGHALTIAGEAGQIFHQLQVADSGIDGEIEFKNEKGEASGKKAYLQLKCQRAMMLNNLL